MKNKLRRLNSLEVWLKNVINRQVANERIVETFEEQYLQHNKEVDRNADPVNILVLDGGGIFGYGGIQMLLSIQELYCKEKGRDLFQQFDFVAGTSIGGVTALGAADLNANGLSTDAILSLKGKGIIDEAREKCFKSMSLKNILFSNQLVRKDSQVIDVLQPDFDKPLRQTHCIPTMVCIAAVKERHVFNGTEETLKDIATRELEPFIARTYEYPLISKACDQPKPLASSSSDMKLHEAMAATSAAPVVFDSVKTEIDGKVRILGDGGIFQNCPMALALDEVCRLYPTRPLGVILNIGYGPEEENLIHRTIETARLVHPNLHYQRIAPHEVFKDLSATETDRKIIADMEAQVEQFIKNTPRVKNALRVTMKKLLQSKPRCYRQNSVDRRNSLSKEVTFEVKHKRKKKFLQKFKMCQSL